MNNLLNEISLELKEARQDYDEACFIADDYHYMTQAKHDIRLAQYRMANFHKTFEYQVLQTNYRELHAECTDFVDRMFTLVALADAGLGLDRLDSVQTQILEMRELLFDQEGKLERLKESKRWSV
jgi:hypothetical protein